MRNLFIGALPEGVKMLTADNGKKYLSVDFKAKGVKNISDWQVLFSWHPDCDPSDYMRSSYVSVLKKTNNPFGGKLGKDFPTVDKALEHYSSATMKANIIQAEGIAKKLGYKECPFKPKKK